MKIAQVIVSISNADIDKLYDYRIDDGMVVKEGTRVVVPFGIGNKKLTAYVLAVKNETKCDESKLKSIISVIDDEPVITDEMLQIAKWMKEKYYTTYAKCLQCVLPAGMKSKKTMSKKVSVAKISDFAPLEELSEIIDALCDSKTQFMQGQVLKMLYENGETETDEIKSVLLISDSTIRTLKKKGMLEIFSREVKHDIEMGGASAFSSLSEANKLTLNEGQREAYESLSAMLSAGVYKKALIHGITGSGKTEVYLRLIDDVINNGKQAIMLVPEISLTPQTVARFQSRFGRRVTVTHSKMTLTERYDQWKKALLGEISVIIGPRSAVFAPFSNLGIIIIDEEHEHTYKSEITPKYDAREVAAERLKISGGLFVMGTATPSVETYYEAKNGEMELFTLSERAKASPLPQVTVADMRKELMEGNRSIFSGLLRDELKACLDGGEQAILFLNRRGFASFVSCRQCGQAIKCEDCNVSYTYHKGHGNGVLMCHYCGRKIPCPKTCPSCGSERIKQFGSGTQKIEEEVLKLFPSVKTLRMDYDTVSGAMGKNAYEAILGAFAEGKADILIGTQMIAKGHDFGNVTLVGIVAADISLNSGCYKSAETTFQLMTQVAGRAGRASLPGKVIAQTYNPEHYAVFHAKTQNYEGFYNEEIRIRKRMNYPPFTKLFVVLLTGENEKQIIIALQQLKKIMEHYKIRGDYELIGPAPCTISKIKKRFRWKIVVKSAIETKLVSFCVYCAQKLKETVTAEELDGINISMTLNPGSIE